MDLLNRMERAEWDYCDKLDSQGPVVIAGIEFSRSLILKELNETVYDNGLLDYFAQMGIDPDDE